MTEERISVIGLGKLGACIAASLANAGYRVTGIDLNEELVNTINQGEAPFPEPKLQEYIDNAGGRLRTDTQTQGNVSDTDVTFIVVNTPSTDDGRYSLKYVQSVCEDLGEELAEKDDYHLVVMTSTVFPGSTEGEIKDWLEEASGKRAGEGFGLCYSPEFIAIGDVIDGLEEPDFFLIGEDTERAGDTIASIYKNIERKPTPVARMDPVTAEITKISVNSYITTKISFANTMAEICDGYGGDVDTVTDALAMDSRISGKYLSAGGRYGGPCFPRDNVAFNRAAEDAGTVAPIALSTDEVNDQHTRWIAEAVRDFTPNGGRVAVLGVTYKPGTYIVEESQGAELLRELNGEFDLSCYDPMGMDEAKKEFGDAVQYHEDVTDALKTADTAVIATQWEEFLETNCYPDRDLTVLDVWRVLDRDRLPPAVSYVPLGSRNSVGL